MNYLRYNNPMSKKILSILDYSFLIIFTLFMWINDPIKYNYTGLLNHSSTRVISIILCLYWCFLLLYHLYELKKKQNIFILFPLILCTMFTPYSDTGDFLSQLHLMLALITLFYLHWLLYSFYWYSRKITTFYVCCLLLSGFFVLTYSSITGISEWIFVVGLMLSLHLLDHSYKK
jgi:uncharacterized membrane protein YfhO